MTEDYKHELIDIVTQLGYECVNVAIRTDNGRLKLQILIDTLGGITAGDCELVSGHVSKYLDEHTDLPALDKGRYYLEVSSPGIERPLFTANDYERFTGREARLRLSESIAGRKTFTGVIRGVRDNVIELECEDGMKHIPFANVKGGNLVYRYNAKQGRKGKKCVSDENL